VAKPGTPVASIVEPAHWGTALHGASGPVVVLIPGLSTPGAVWDSMAEKLAADHRVLVVEVKGFDGARTPANEGAGMIDGIVGDIAADLKRRGLARPVVVGHSFGGLVAMKLAVARPEVARSVVVVDALPFFGTVFGDKETVESMALSAFVFAATAATGRGSRRPHGTTRRPLWGDADSARRPAGRSR